MSDRWAFSVGLFHTWQHPEVIVFGLDDSSLINAVSLVGKGIAAGRSFEPGKEYAGIVEDRTVRFVRACMDWYPIFLGYAQWFYRSAKFPLLQLVWPDHLRRFPGDSGSEARNHQPDLERPITSSGQSDRFPRPY
jgi:hypothetical protein